MEARAGTRPNDVPLRRRLRLIAIAAIVPISVAGGIALSTLLLQQIDQGRNNGQDLARALAAAIDAELRLSGSTLQSIALAWPNEPDRQRGLAEAALSAHPEWSAMLLSRASSGEVLAAFGSGVEAAADATRSAGTTQTGTSTIGSLNGADGRIGGVPIRAPLGGDRGEVLTAILRPDAMRLVLERQELPADWVVSVFDAHRRRVARSRDHLPTLGGPPSGPLVQLIEDAKATGESFGTTVTLEGAPVHTAVATVGSTGWTVALGIPTAVGEAAIARTALTYGAGTVVSVLLGLWAAWRAAKGIERPMSRLRAAAAGLGRGEAIHYEAAGIVEVDAVGRALVDAAGERARHTAEREALLAAERAARDAAEQARERMQLLLRAGILLSNSLDERTTLEAIATLLVPDIADACRIDLLDGNRRLQRKITRHADPARQKALEQFVARNTAPDDTPGTFPWVMRTGQSFLGNFASPQDVPAQDDGVRDFARLVGMRAAYVVPLVARGQTIGAMAVMQADSGRRIEAEDTKVIDQLAQRAALALDNSQLLGRAQAALEDASTANRAKDEFLAMLGHELRNPLAPIVGALELMAQRDGERNAVERDMIGRQVRHLRRLVDDLLDVSRIASGKVDLDLRTVDMREVVRRALELAEPVLAQRAAPTVVLPAAAATVRGDVTRLTQAVGNLLLNAAKFSEPQAPIALTLRLGAGSVQLDVVDRGIGIDAALLPRLFERFVQGSQSLNRARGGLGLGLAITRNLVQLHGGEVSARSDGPGHGSTFTITLPAVQEALPPPHAAAPDAVATKAERVLVVDDNVDAAETLAMLLSLEGHQVRTAPSAREVWPLLDGFSPDVVVLDIGLPEVDGYELARRLRRDRRTAGAYLVALTGYGRDSDRAKAFGAGFDAHMSKPVEIDSLLAVLAERPGRPASAAVPGSV